MTLSTDLDDIASDWHSKQKQKSIQGANNENTSD